MQDAMELVDRGQTVPGSATSVTVLSEMITEDCAALEQRFCGARWQGPVGLEGHPPGRMLAVPGFDRGAVARDLRRSCWCGSRST
jgi:hypothetical protein